MLTYTRVGTKPSQRRTHLLRDANRSHTMCGHRPDQLHPERFVTVPYDAVGSERYWFVRWCRNCLKLDEQERVA